MTHHPLARHLLLPLCAAALAACASPAPAGTDAEVAAVDDVVDAATADAGVDADTGATDVAADAAADVAVDAEGLPPGTKVIVTADTASLTPPPLSTWFTATVEGKDVTGQCPWTVGPPEVCKLTPPNGAFRVGLGTCTATCALPGGAVGKLDLPSVPQPVLYLLGGSYTKPNSAVELDSGVSRLRIFDKQWGAHPRSDSGCP